MAVKHKFTITKCEFTRDFGGGTQLLLIGQMLFNGTVTKNCFVEFGSTGHPGPDVFFSADGLGGEPILRIPIGGDPDRSELGGMILGSQGHLALTFETSGNVDLNIPGDVRCTACRLRLVRDFS